MSTDNLALSPPSTPDYGVNLVPDIDFAVKDPAVIEAEVIADYESAFLTLTGIAKTLAPGDPVRLHLLAVCAWLSHQRVIIDFTGKNNLLKYARGDYLDNLAALHGNRALRLQASPALCTLRFTLTSPLAYAATIPKGTQCQASNVIFQTTDDLTIPPGGTTGDVGAEAILPGFVGNGFLPGQVNLIINWNQPFGLTVANTDTTAGGSDEETDDQYRYRVWLAIESYSTCGPHDAYEFWALSADPSIIQAVVYSAPAIAGEVWIFPLVRDSNGVPQPASSEICDKVLAQCSAVTRRPVSDYVTVSPPVTRSYTVNIDYWVSSGHDVLLATIQDNVTKAVNDWVLWERSYVSRDIVGDELRRRCLEAGAKRIVIHQPSPDFQVMNYNELAVVDTWSPTAPGPGVIINYMGLEDP